MKDKQEVKEVDIKPIGLSNLMAIKFPEIKWVVEQLVPTDGIIAISGSPASYKTWFVLDLAIKVSSGQPLFDTFTTAQTGVLIVDEENGQRLLQDRFNRLIKDKGFNLPIYTLSLEEFKLTRTRINNLIRFTKDNNIGVVIFDSLVRIHNNEENSATAMAETFSHLRHMTKHGLTVVFTHHHRKTGAFQQNQSEDMRGSSDILASVNCHLAVKRKPNESLLTVSQPKLRDMEEMKSFQLELIKDGEYLSFEFSGELSTSKSKTDQVKEEIRKILLGIKKPMPKTDIHKAIGIDAGHSTIKNTLSEMVKEGELLEQKGAKNTTLCSLNPTYNPSLPLTSE